LAFPSEQTIVREPLAASKSWSALENRSLVLGLILVLGCLVLYNPAGHYPFTNFDDDHYVTDNPQVSQGLNWKTIRWAFTTTAEANWHPLTWLSHELDWQLFHQNPAGHHYVNVLFEATNAWLLFLVLLEATGSVWRSWVVAALFALHPINVESVAWVSERKNLLSMFCFLAALKAYRWYAQRPGPGRYGLVAAWFAMGLMAKPQVITFPFVLLLWDYWPLQRMDSGHQLLSSANSGDPLPVLPLWRLVQEKIPLFALSAASAVITLKAQAAGGAIRTLRQVPIPVRIGNAVLSYARYLAKAFWPSRLSPMYPYLWSSAQIRPLVFSLFVLLLVSVLVIAMDRRYLLVGWLWFLGTLVPMIGLVQVGGQAMADRYAYLPFVGLFLMVSWGVAEIAERRQWPAAVPAVAAAIALTALSVTARRQLGYWSDNATLWSHAIEVTGPNFQAQEHLGSALVDDGRIGEAGAHFEAGVAIDAREALGHFNLAVYDQHQGRVERAIAGYNNVLRLEPDQKLEGQTLVNLAMAYRQVGNYPLAETTYKAAVQADPNNPKTWLGMGLLEQKTGQFAAAAEAFSRSAEIQPSALDYLLLEKAFQGSGQTAEAVTAHQKARQLSEDLEPMQRVADGLLAQ
jgi:protein O-mannosyl-transferase